MISEHFIWIGILINFVGCGDYLIDTLRGRTQPNRVTWLLWTVVGGITVAAQVSESASLVVATTAATCFLTGGVFLSSFVNRNAYWRLGTVDYLCGAMAIITLLLWKLTASGNLAIALSILTDLLASYPTVVKAYKSPGSEKLFVYVAGMINAGLALLTIDHWKFANYAFLTYTFVICLVIAAFVFTLPRVRGASVATDVPAGKDLERSLTTAVE